MLLTVLGAVLIAAVAVVALAWMFQRQLIYFPVRGEVPPAATVIPGAEDVTFDTADGLRLHGWFVPASGQATATVLVFNGNGGNRADRAGLAEELSRAGLSVLLMDYRGYGDNPGSPSEGGLLADARAALTYLHGRDDVQDDRIVYFGESLGTGVAVQLAAEEPPAALVLRSPFTSLADVGQDLYPWLPVRLFLADRYDSVGHVRDLRVPMLVVVAERDTIIPPEHSRRLAAAAPGGAELVVVPGAGHNDPEMFTGETLIGAVVTFVTEQVEPA